MTIETKKRIQDFAFVVIASGCAGAAIGARESSFAVAGIVFALIRLKP